MVKNYCSISEHSLVYAYNWLKWCNFCISQDVKKINSMLIINIFRNSSQNDLDVLKGDFWGFGCPNDTHMPCSLRLCSYLSHLWGLLPVAGKAALVLHVLMGVGVGRGPPLLLVHAGHRGLLAHGSWSRPRSRPTLHWSSWSMSGMSRSWSLHWSLRAHSHGSRRSLLGVTILLVSVLRTLRHLLLLERAWARGRKKRRHATMVLEERDRETCNMLLTPIGGDANHTTV